jgi:hypothetical protein
MALTKAHNRMIADAAVNVKDFGAVGDGVTDDTAAIQAALDSGAKKVILPSGNYKITTTLNLPTNVCLQGHGMGHGAFSNTRISAYHTSGAVIQFFGYYCEVRDLELWYEGASKATVTGVNYTTVTRTYLENVTIFGFEKGVTNSKTPTTFTHLHRNVYIKDCTIGVDLQYVNNVVFDACFIESNGTNLKVDVFTNVVLCNGTVIEIFGDERLSETTSSVCLQVSNGYNFVCRDCYFEVGTLAGAGTTLKAATVFSVNGFVFESNYINRSAQNQAPMILFTDAGSSAVSVKNNYFLRGPSSGTDYFVKGDTGFEDVVYGFEVSNNAVKFNMIEKEVAFTPVITENGGTAIPGIAYSVQQGTFTISGGICNVEIYIMLSNAGTGTGYSIEIPLPYLRLAGLNASNEGVCFVKTTNISILTTNMGWGKIESNDNEIFIFRMDNISVKSTNLANNSEIRLSMSFPVDRQAI